MTRASQLSQVANTYSNRNLIINGAMQISQRGTSWSHAHDGTQFFYTIDRYQPYLRSTHSTLDGTWSQSTDAPDGFSNSLLWTTGTAESSVNTDDYFYIRTKLEGQTLQQLAYGTSSAKVSTVSFWVKSSVTGTYGFSMYNQDSNRQLAIPYTINSANTWEKKTITIPADTTGSIDNDNNASFNFYWIIDAGSDFTSTPQSTWATYAGGMFAGGHSQNGVATTSSATFAITGIQYEVGETATEFEHRPYGIELALCERYYQLWSAGWTGVAASANYNYSCHINWHTMMRANPTVTRNSGTDSARYPAANWATTHSYSYGTTVRVMAASAGGNDNWYALGSADAEL